MWLFVHGCVFVCGCACCSFHDAAAFVTLKGDGASKDFIGADPDGYVRTLKADMDSHHASRMRQLSDRVAAFAAKQGLSSSNVKRGVARLRGSFKQWLQQQRKCNRL